MAQLLVVILHESAQLPALLDAWQDIGLPGTTILDSAGARRAKGWLQRVGFQAIGELFSASEVRNKTLLSVVENEALLEKAITVTEEIIGDLNVPHKGLLFVVPITQVRGLITRKEEKTRPLPSPLTETTDIKLITRETPVSVADEILNLKPTIVQRNLDLMTVAEVMVNNPSVTVASVVNDRQRLVGLLPLRDLVDDLFLGVIPEEYLSETRDWDDALHFADLSRTRTAGDAMRPAVFIQRDDRVKDAFQSMHRYKLSGVPVVNEQHEVTGYINLLELLALYCRSQHILTDKDEQIGIGYDSS
jgi:nitrogen regulatory protein P-II 1